MTLPGLNLIINQTKFSTCIGILSRAFLAPAEPAKLSFAVPESRACQMPCLVVLRRVPSLYKFRLGRPRPASAVALLGTVAASCPVELRVPVDLAWEYHSRLLNNR